MIATYILTNIYTSPEFVVFSVIAITIILIIAGYLITQGVGRITEAKLTAEREKKKTESIVMNLSDGLLMLDNAYNIILLNPCAEKYLGIDKKQIIGLKTFGKEINKFPNLKKIINKIPGSPTDLKTIEENILIESPEKRYLRITTSPVYDNRRTFIGFVKVLHDFTKEKEIENMKTEFVSLASHQLRSPLSSLRWLLEILLRGRIGALSEEQTKVLTQMNESNDRMIKTVQDLLNVSRIEEGRTGLELSLTDFNQIVDNAIKDVNAQAQKKQIKINFEKQDIKKAMLDPEKIKIVVQNLIDNAVKYTKEKGEIKINSELKDNKIFFSVKDNGIGIPEVEQEKIFTKFHRSKNAKLLSVHGTGLGLYIAKKIVETHKGKIWFASKQDQGTTFYIELPTNIS
jgi:two-component system phosphate regulon sensor histidine kinase PhoR